MTARLMKRTIILAAFLAGIAPACAQEQGGGHRGPGPDLVGTYWMRPEAAELMRFDANHDGVLTADEVAAGADAAFKDADEDHSGTIRALEYADWAEKTLGARDATPGFLMMDSDGDLELSPAEFRAGWLDVFHHYDHDKKGTLAMKDVIGGQSNGARDDVHQGGREGKSRRRP